MDKLVVTSVSFVHANCVLGDFKHIQTCNALIQVNLQ